jgi:hypothetical protein
MKSVVIVTLILALSGVTPAKAAAENKVVRRVADASDICLANCASENRSCKSVCPTTYSVPCVSACDNQAQFCRQTCQRK